MNTRKSTTLRMVGSAALALALLTPTAAANSDGDDQPTPPDFAGTEVPDINDTPQSSSTLTTPAGTPDGEVPAQATRIPSPARCTGKTDYPHKSADGVSVSVHAETKCDYPVQRVSTNTAIFRYRWFGPQYVVGKTSEKLNSRTSGKATPHGRCVGQGTFSYVAVSVHTSVENDAIYKATTANEQNPGVSTFEC